MSLKDKIMSDMQDAMRSGDELRKWTLRMARASIKNAEIARIAELDDAGVQDILRKEIKQRRESAEEYQKGNRPELAEKELAEITFLEVYLPTQMSETQVESEVRAVLAGMDNPGPKEMGKVMPVVMGKLKGQADGRMVSQVVTRLLAEGAS